MVAFITNQQPYQVLHCQLRHYQYFYACILVLFSKHFFHHFCFIARLKCNPRQCVYFATKQYKTTSIVVLLDENFQLSTHAIFSPVHSQTSIIWILFHRASKECLIQVRPQRWQMTPPQLQYNRSRRNN